jgi:hypothetical protein
MEYVPKRRIVRLNTLGHIGCMNRRFVLGIVFRFFRRVICRYFLRVMFRFFASSSKDPGIFLVRVVAAVELREC